MYNDDEGYPTLKSSSVMRFSSLTPAHEPVVYRPKDLGTAHPGPSSSTKKYGKLKIVPVWEVEEHRGMQSASRVNCIFKDSFIQSYRSNELEKPLVDTVTLTKYKLLQGNLFADQRLESIRRGTIELNKTYTDQEILSEMKEMYGHLDETSENFKLLFENYKESFLEEVEHCKKDEQKTIEGLVKSGCAIIKPNYKSSDKTREEILQVFTPAELENLEDIHCMSLDITVDWLNLPRPKNEQGYGTSALRQWRPHYDYAAHSDSESGVDDDHDHDLDGDLVFGPGYIFPLNLCRADPKYCNFAKWMKTDEELKVGLALCSRLEKLISQYPSGITPHIFMEKFLHNNKYLIDFKGLGFPSLETFFLSLPDIFHCVESAQYRTILLFPSTLKDFLAPMSTIYERIRHFILVLMACSPEGRISVDEIQKMLYEEFWFPGDITNWGFSCMKSFLQVQLQCDIYDMCLLEVKKADRINDATEWYVVHLNSWHLDDFLSWKTEVEKEILKTKDVSMRTYLPPGYMKYYEPIPSCDIGISVGDTLPCVITSVFNPFKITAVPLCFWNELEGFQLVIQESHWRSKKDPSEKEIRSLLQIGLPVLIYCPSDDSNKEWYRGIILGRVNQLFRTLMIDYGTVAIVSMENIRYLPHQLAIEIPAYAVFLQLRMSSSFRKYQKNSSLFTAKHVSVFDSLVHEGEACIKFHSCAKDSVFGRGFRRWTVSIMIFHKTTKKVIYPDLSRALEVALVKEGLEEETSLTAMRRHPCEIWTQSPATNSQDYVCSSLTKNRIQK